MGDFSSGCEFKCCTRSRGRTNIFDDGEVVAFGVGLGHRHDGKVRAGGGCLFPFEFEPGSFGSGITAEKGDTAFTLDAKAEMGLRVVELILDCFSDPGDFEFVDIEFTACRSDGDDVGGAPCATVIPFVAARALDGVIPGCLAPNCAGRIDSVEPKDSVFSFDPTARDARNGYGCCRDVAAKREDDLGGFKLFAVVALPLELGEVYEDGTAIAEHEGGFSAVICDWGGGIDISIENRSELSAGRQVCGSETGFERTYQKCRDQHGAEFILTWGC